MRGKNSSLARVQLPCGYDGPCGPESAPPPDHTPIADAGTTNTTAPERWEGDDVPPMPRMTVILVPDTALTCISSRSTKRYDCASEVATRPEVRLVFGAGALMPVADVTDTMLMLPVGVAPFTE